MLLGNTKNTSLCTIIIDSTILPLIFEVLQCLCTNSLITQILILGYATIN